MSGNLHNIDKLFRDGIDSHEELPQEKLWEGIEAGLDKSNVVDIRRRYNNLKRVAAVLLVLLLSVVSYEIFKTKESVKGDAVAGNKKTEAHTGNNRNVNTNDAVVPSNNNNTVAENNNRNNSVNFAGYDSLSNSKSSGEDNDAATADKIPAAQTANSNTVNIENNIATVKNTKKQKPVLLPAVKNNTDEDYDKTTGNKGTTGSRTRIKSTAPQQYTDDSNTINENDAANNSNTVVTELAPLKKSKADLLAARINRALQVNGDVMERQSPNVAAAKMRNKKSFHFNVIPFFASQFTSNEIREEKNTPPGGQQGPGGPPPPRPGNDGHKKQYKTEEQSQSSFSAGIIAEVPLAKNWSVQTGITYLQRDINIEPKKIYARPDKDGKVKYVFDCASGYSYISSKTGAAPANGDSINVTDSKNTLGYIGVPVAASYKISLGKFSLVPTAGAVLNFLTKKKIATQLVQGSTKEQQSINNINGLASKYVNATAGVALEYNFNKKVSLHVMPSGNFALNSINNSDAAVKSYPNAFAVSAGLKINL